MNIYPAQKDCIHPVKRQYSWLAINEESGKKDIICVGCCRCGKILHVGPIKN